MTHRLLAHTAELRAELAAPDLPALYAEGTRLVREILAGASPVAARENRWVRLDGTDEGERFFRFLRELVYLADAESFLPACVRLEGSAAVIGGERFDPERHESERPVRGVARRHCRLEREPAGFRCEVVFEG